MEEAAFMAVAVLLVELLMAALAVLLGADVVDVDDCVTTLGSVEGMGFPSLVCSFTTYQWKKRKKQNKKNLLCKSSSTTEFHHQFYQHVYNIQKEHRC